tara:strand:+ start:1237 stop:1458 length:222 start_codon:yes stop_codon:yes gene_type:complete
MKTETLRTQEQAIEIYESTYNGNWSTAAKELREYGFQYWEFIEMIDEYHEDIGLSESRRLEILRTLSHLIGAR